jgi:large subunit ribosomal protein L30e
METDLNKIFRSVLSTGKVVIGTRQAIDAAKNKTAQMVVLSSNCLENTRNELKGIPAINYPGNGFDLGIACGKPFSITAFAVLEPGDSGILSLKEHE